MYVGMTRNLSVAMRQLKDRSVIPPGMAAGVERLLFWREFSDPIEAHRFELTLHHLSRKTLLELAKNVNPFLTDLSADWFADIGSGAADGDSVIPDPVPPNSYGTFGRGTMH